MTVLCVIESDDDGPADASLRALTVARGLADSASEDLAAAWFGPAEMIDSEVLLTLGVGKAYAIASGVLSGYAPLAWARALASLPVTAVVAAATDRGNEVLAHLGAITGLPMAANCVSAARTGPGECHLVRQRWAGSLLEEAVLEAPLALLTVAADAVPADAVPAGAAPAAP